MKLLFDQNLSPRLVQQTADLYPNSSHVQFVSLDRSPDEAVWNYARDNGFVLVTKDADFNERSVIHGFPPKVLWLVMGNCATAAVEAALRRQHQAIEDFYVDPNAGTLILS